MYGLEVSIYVSGTCKNFGADEKKILSPRNINTGGYFWQFSRSILGDLACDLAGSDHLQFCIANNFLGPGCQITC